MSSSAAKKNNGTIVEHQSLIRDTTLQPDECGVSVDLLGPDVPDEFYSLAVLLRGKLNASPVDPDLCIIRLSEAGLTLKSSAGMAVNGRIEITCDTLSRTLDNAQSFPCTVARCTRAGYGAYTIDVVFRGLSETAIDTLRAIAIRGEVISDFL